MKNIYLAILLCTLLHSFYYYFYFKFYSQCVNIPFSIITSNLPCIKFNKSSVPCVQNQMLVLIIHIRYYIVNID